MLKYQWKEQPVPYNYWTIYGNTRMFVHICTRTYIVFCSLTHCFLVKTCGVLAQGQFYVQAVGLLPERAIKYQNRCWLIIIAVSICFVAISLERFEIKVNKVPLRIMHLKLQPWNWLMNNIVPLFHKLRTQNRNDNLRCHQWPQSWHHDNSKFSVCKQHIVRHTCLTR